MAIAYSGSRKASRISIWDRLEYRFIVGILFTFCLATAVTKRAVAVVAQPGVHQEERQSIVAEAKSVAHTAAGYAFKR